MTNIWQPIRTDGSNLFAYHTMTERLPQIIDDVVERNAIIGQSKSRLLTLRDAVQDNAIIAPPLVNTPHYHDLEASYQAHRQETWLDSEWFFAETYFFNRLLQDSNYWSMGRDPFAPMKLDEIHSQALHERVLRVAHTDTTHREARLHQLLEASLWGNRVDLSHPSALKIGEALNPEDLLIDNRHSFIEALNQDASPNYDSSVLIITDNVGTELAMDLLLAAHLIEEWHYRVILNVKIQPTYVSDATAHDVRYQIEHFPHMPTRDILRAAMDTWKFMIDPDFIWNSSHFLRTIAQTHWHKLLASFIIIKGDANYRRAVNDTMYPIDNSLTDIVDYLPAPTLFLRTLKSDALCGIPHDIAHSLAVQDPQWRVNGQRGVIQFVKVLSG